MSGNGQHDDQVLSWPKRLLSADDLRRHLNGQRELQLLPRTVVTPLAADELRARGVRITWQSPPPAGKPPSFAGWGYAQERPDTLVAAAVQALERDGVSLVSLPSSVGEIAAQIAASSCAGAVFFCGDPVVVCCIANKHSGLRAAAVLTAAHAARARVSLGANLFAVELPGRTYFELRQILRTIATAPATCPADLADTLKELDGHAHR
jgi:hypothetical protein